MAVNTVVLVGRLTSDPEVKQTTSGVSVSNFTIAVDKPYNKEHDHPEASFIDCVAWRGSAEFLGKYFSKGRKIGVTGSLETETYTVDGKNRKATKVVVSSIDFVDSKKENENTNVQVDTSAETSNDEELEEDPF